MPTLSNLRVPTSSKVLLILLFDAGFFYFIVIRCLPKLAAPPGGKMDCSKSNIYGSVCSFSCRHGYTLEGSARRVCEMNGTTLLGVWTGIDTRCARKNFFLTHA